MEVERIIDRYLNEEQRALAEERFMSKLTPPERSHVAKVLFEFDKVAEGYFKTDCPEFHTDFSRFNYWDDSPAGYPFFTVYGIGSCLRGSDARDIDLLVVSNVPEYGDKAMSQTTFLDLHGLSDIDHMLFVSRILEDPFMQRVYLAFKDAFSIEPLGKLPDEYNMGVTEGKVLVQLIPKEGTSGRKIDVNYVRPLNPSGRNRDDTDSRFCFLTPDEFESKDVDREGNTLDRVLLYSCSSQNIGDIISEGGDCLSIHLNGRRYVI